MEQRKSNIHIIKIVKLLQVIHQEGVIFHRASDCSLIIPPSSYTDVLYVLILDLQFQFNY